MARDLDEQVESFRTRPLDQGPYTFVATDALVLKVRENGHVMNVHALIAVGINKFRHREILGIDVSSVEDKAGWLTFFRGLVARGLCGVKLVTSEPILASQRRSERLRPVHCGNAAARTTRSISCRSPRKLSVHE